MKTLLTATALILSMTAAASAADTTGSTVLAGGPIFTEAQANLYCEYINFGTANVTPTAQEIFELGSTTAVSSVAFCTNGTAVAPNQSCYILPSTTLDAGHTYSCKVTFGASAAHVRGSLQLYDSSYNVLSTVELR